MTMQAKCGGCGHVFPFDTERVSRIRQLLESEGAKQPPVAFIVECPKCKMRNEVANPKT